MICPELGVDILRLNVDSFGGANNRFSVGIGAVLSSSGRGGPSRSQNCPNSELLFVPAMSSSDWKNCDKSSERSTVAELKLSKIGNDGVENEVSVSGSSEG